MADDDKIRLVFETVTPDGRPAADGIKEVDAVLGELRDELGVTAEEEAASAKAAKGFADELTKLREQIIPLISAQETLSRLYAHGIMTQEEYAGAIANIRGELAPLKTAYTTLGGSMDSLEGGTVNAMQAFNQFGHIARELATGRIYGLMGSIQRLTLALGGPEGAALAAGAMGLALYELAPRIKKWVEDITGYTEAVEKGKSQTEQLADKIKELDKKEVKLAVDYSDLENAKKQSEDLRKNLAAFKKEMPTEDEKEVGKQITEALTEESAQGGYEGIKSKIKASVYNQLRAVSPAFQPDEVNRLDTNRKRLAELKARGPKTQMEAASWPTIIGNLVAQIAGQEESMRRAEQQMQDSAEARTGGLLREAEAGKASGVRNLGAALTQAGMGALGGAITGTTAEKLRTQREVDERLETTVERQKAGRIARDKRERIKEENAYGLATEEDQRIAESGRTIHRQMAAADRAEKERFRQQDRDEREQQRLDREAEQRKKQEDREQKQQSDAFSERAIRLMESGWDAMSAQQETYAEMEAKAMGLIERYAMLVRNAQQITARLRMQERAMMKADQDMTMLPFGFPM